MDIPPLIHQTWHSSQPPAEMAQLARTWRDHHPRWEYRLWTDRDCRVLIEQCAPWFLPVYGGYPEPIMRVDAFRYFLMFHVGGVYVDLDFDRSWDRLAALRPELEQRFHRVSLSKQDFGFRPTVPRWDPRIQRQRRAILARSRNLLIDRGLAPDDEWVLWIDVDMVRVPPDLIQLLLAAGEDVVAPHVVPAETGDTFDLNTWRLQPGAADIDWNRWLLDGVLQPPRGLGRQYLGELEDQPLVELDGVGGCVLLIRAELHRRGLRFPEEPIDGLIETEGLAVLVRARGSACFGLPGVRAEHG